MVMRQWRLGFLAAAVGLLVAVSGCDLSPGVDTSNNEPDLTAREPIAPEAGKAPLVGAITAVEDGIASIDIGYLDGVRKGMRLVLRRDGRFVAYLEVIEVNDRIAAGAIYHATREAKPGDQVGLVSRTVQTP